MSLLTQMMKSQNWNSDDTWSSFDLGEDLKVMPSVNINAPEDPVAVMKGKIVVVETDSDKGTPSQVLLSVFFR